jgi:Xaa-Pro aminopeptidase
LLKIQIAEVKEQFSTEFILAIVVQREIKTNEEVLEIEKAVNISVDMHIAAMKHAKPGMTEAEVAAIVHQVTLAGGGDIAFPIIATINGQTLHNHYHGNEIKPGQLFLLDAGGQTSMGYTGDLSTTFPVSGNFTAKQKDIYLIVQRAKSHAESILEVGIPFKEVHKQACLELIKGLKEAGLMTGDEEEAYESGAHALFFPCGLGHMMGLDVHDMENLGERWVGYDGDNHEIQFGIKSLRLAKPLREGFVLTIEPGIYFIPELQEMWKANKINESFLCWNEINRYHNFGGLRIEDNYLIEDGKYRLLGKQIPRSIQDIEGLRQRG